MKLTRWAKRHPFLLLTLFIAACGSVNPRRYKHVRWATFCPNPDPKTAIICEGADREEYDAFNGFYYCYFDCALYQEMLADWRVIFAYLDSPNAPHRCWTMVKVEHMGECADVRG